MSNIYIGTNKLKGNYIGENKVKKIYIDSVLVWSGRVPVNKPTQLTPSATYSGDEITNGYTTPDGIIMSGSNKGTNAGSYTATYTPDEGHCWEDESISPITITLSIERASVGAKPSTSVSRIYNRGPQDNGYTTPTGVSMSGNNSGTNAGTYTAVYTPDNNHKWSDDTTSDVTVDMIISAYNLSGCTIATPSAVTYTGSAQTPTPAVSHGDVALSSSTEFTYSYTNNTNAGTATVTATGKGNYTGTKSVNFTINRKSAGAKPGTSITRNYNGSAQNNGYTTPTGITMTGTASATNGGTYTATYTPQSNYCWSDNTTGAVSRVMTIQYVWNKYNSALSYAQASQDTRVGGAPIPDIEYSSTAAKIYVTGTSYSFSTTSGLYTISNGTLFSGSSSTTAATTSKPYCTGLGVTSGSANHIYQTIDGDMKYYAYTSGYRLQGSAGKTYKKRYTSSSYIKGSTSYGTVANTTNSSAYPANGRHTDGYWYVKTW